MPILPIRNLGQIGVVSDLNSYDLPPNGVSKVNNARFDDGKIKRSNVFRSVLATSAPTPVFTFTQEIANGFDKIGIADRNGKVWFLQSGTEDEVTESTWVSTNSDEPWTFTYLQGVGYLNRVDRVPWYYGGSMTDFAKLTNWDSTWRCAALRAYKDYLIALNVTKGANNYPNMVKWSDIAQYGSVPGSWDETDTTISAGENTLGELRTAIKDGCPLRDVFVIYSQDQVWQMEETGDALVFRFRKLFDDDGIINTNCVVEVDGRHYVFGTDDIYVHDGNSKETILDGRNWHYVYGNLNKQETEKCWVQHNPDTSEVLFAYVSGDADANFTATSYCNRAAVFNYKNETWSFIDLPNVSNATIANFATTVTYATATATWDGMGGTWYDQESLGSNLVFMTSPQSTANGLTASRLYGYDSPNKGVLPFSVSTEATKQAFIERIGIDLDDTGDELRTYKIIKSIYPQMNLLEPGQTVDFQFAGVAYPNATVSWAPSVSFSPVSGYKVDTREGGRYLAWRMTTNDYNNFELSGFDADVVSTGRR